MARRYYKPEIETMAREDFLGYVWRELKAQMAYTYAHSGLCQRQFQKAKITPDDIKSLSDFVNKVPFTTKQDLLADQQENPPYGTRLSIPERDIWITYLTSGTSGKGQEVHTGTQQDWEEYFTGLYLIYTWVGWKKGDRIMNPIPYSLAPGGFGHTMGMQRYGLSVFNTGIYDTRTKLEYAKRFQIEGVFTVPAYLATLTNDVEKMGLDPAKDLAMRRVLIATAAYPVSFIQKMEEKWNAKIFDYYGSTQLALGCTCEKGAVSDGKRGFYHLFQHRAYHEVINPETLQPVAPGEVGEVVVTPLRKKGSPFLRFRSADRARYFFHDACDCGRPFDLLEAGTIARYDDMMKIKGTNVWPETIDEIILTKDEAAEYQARVYISADDKEKAEIFVEFKPNVAPERKQKLLFQIEEEARDKTGLGFILKEAPDKLPRFDFKARRWKDERIKGLEKK